MQRVKYPPIRNKINTTDPAQLRAWTRRLRVPADDLKAIVEKVGNSRRRREQGSGTAALVSPALSGASDRKLDPARAGRTRAGVGLTALVGSSSEKSS